MLKLLGFGKKIEKTSYAEVETGEVSKKQTKVKDGREYTTELQTLAYYKINHVYNQFIKKYVDNEVDNRFQLKNFVKTTKKMNSEEFKNNYEIPADILNIDFETENQANLIEITKEKISVIIENLQKKLDNYEVERKVEFRKKSDDPTKLKNTKYYKHFAAKISEMFEVYNIGYFINKQMKLNELDHLGSLNEKIINLEMQLNGRAPNSIRSN